MPLFQYACKKCQHAFEVLSRADQKPVCPSCGTTRVAKQQSVPAAHVVASSGSSCPAREACDVGSGGCPGGGCGMGMPGM